MLRTGCYFLLFVFFAVHSSFASPPGAAGPREPKLTPPSASEPDEPLLPDEYHMEIYMDDLKFKEPEEPPTPDLRFGERKEKEPEPLVTEPSPRGIISECPSGLVCR